MAHATPAEIQVASLALHVGTAAILLDHNPAVGVGAPAHVVGQCEALVGSRVLVVAPATLVPRLLALEASVSAAVGALNLHVFALPFNFLFAGSVGAPYHGGVGIDLPRKSDSTEALVLSFGDDCLDHLLGDRALPTDTPNALHIAVAVELGRYVVLKAPLAAGAADFAACLRLRLHDLPHVADTANEVGTVMLFLLRAEEAVCQVGLPPFLLLLQSFAEFLALFFLTFEHG